MPADPSSTPDHEKASAPEAATPADTDTGGARTFALNEDWLATGVGLAIVVLAALGVITEGWLPL